MLCVFQTLVLQLCLTLSCFACLLKTLSSGLGGLKICSHWIIFLFYIKPPSAFSPPQDFITFLPSFGWWCQRPNCYHGEKRDRLRWDGHKHCLKLKQTCDSSTKLHVLVNKLRGVIDNSSQRVYAVGEKYIKTSCKCPGLHLCMKAQNLILLIKVWNRMKIQCHHIGGYEWEIIEDCLRATQTHTKRIWWLPCGQKDLVKEVFQMEAKTEGK